MSTPSRRLFGYDMSEVTIQSQAEIVESARWRLKRHIAQARRPMAVSLGPSHAYAMLPHPDIHSPLNKLYASEKRMARKHSKPTIPGLYARIVNRMMWLIDRLGLTPLPRGVDLSLDAWFPQTNYTKSEEEFLREYISIFTNYFDDPDFTKCKSFVKREFYPEFKFPRGINSRSASFKCFMGPLAKAIENEVYKMTELNQCFIKHIPNHLRPDFISAKFEGAEEIFACDYTAFESQQNAELMKAAELTLYRYMIQNLDDRDKYEFIFDNVLAGRNYCDFGPFEFSIDATRMSGEMVTSLGNGILNLCMIYFVCMDLCGNTEVNAVVEGDDSLFTCFGGRRPTASDFNDCGMTIKMLKFDNVGDASFCGCVFDKDDKIVVTDPIEVILKLGWAPAAIGSFSRTKQLAYLKSKLMSAKATYLGCPMIDSYVTNLLRKLKHIDERSSLKHFDTYKRSISSGSKIDFYSEVTAGRGTRDLVEKLYGISVEDQLYFEEWAREASLDEWSHSSFDKYIPQSYIDYFVRYADNDNLPDSSVLNKKRLVRRTVVRHSNPVCSGDLISSFEILNAPITST